MQGAGAPGAPLSQEPARARWEAAAGETHAAGGRPGQLDHRHRRLYPYGGPIKMTAWGLLGHRPQKQRGFCLGISAAVVLARFLLCASERGHSVAEE